MCPTTALKHDPLRLLAPLRRRLQEDLSAAVLATLSADICVVEDAVYTQLLAHSAPFPGPIRVITLALGEIYERWRKQIARPVPVQVSQGSDVSQTLLKQLLLSLMTHSPVPGDLWPTALALANRNEKNLLALKAMLALSTIQPESHTPKILWLLHLLLKEEAQHVTLRQTAPDNIEGWHWLDSLGNFSTTSLRQSVPNVTSQLLFFQCTALAARIEVLLDTPPGPNHPWCRATGLSATDIQLTLRNIADQWQSPASRRYSRRRQESRVQLCTRLDQLWSALGDAPQEPEENSHWMVLNESAGGYALMHANGPTNGLTAGHALGIKIQGKPWSLCLIRWIRSENSAHVEIGVELLAPEAYAVRLTLPDTEPQAAFLFPALPGLHQGEALLAPREHWGDEHAFVLLTEKAGQLRITPCLRGAPRHQTSSIEVFEFSRLGREG